MVVTRVWLVQQWYVRSLCTASVDCLVIVGQKCTVVFYSVTASSNFCHFSVH